MKSFESGPNIMRGTDNKRKKMQPDLERKMAADLGTEVLVGEATLKYGEKEVGGLLYKRIHSSDFEWARAQQESVLKKWDYLKKVRRELKKKGETGFELPGTVRGFQTETGVGYLVTDLSEGGKIHIQDLKDLELDQQLTWEDWLKIKEAVLRDVEIAVQYGVLLDNGPSSLDPWLVVFKKDGPIVYLSDIGGYTQVVRVGEDTLAFRERSAENVRKALESLELTIKKELENPLRGKFIDDYEE